MMDSVYRLVFRGKLLPGAQAEHAKQQFAALFKLKTAQIDAIFSGKKVVLHKGLSYADALKFQQVCTRCGLQVGLDPETIPDQPVITAIQATSSSQTTQQETFRIAFKGALRSGISIDDAHLTLAAILKCPYEKVAEIFPGKSLVLRQNLSREQAEQFKARFERAGLITSIEQELSIAPMPSNVYAGASMLANPSSPVLPKDEEYQDENDEEGENSNSIYEDEATPPPSFFGISLQGRMGRLSFLGGYLTVGAVTCLLLNLILLVIINMPLSPATTIRLGIVVCSLAAVVATGFNTRLMVLRCHDLERSGWWVLLVFILQLASLAGVMWGLLNGMLSGVNEWFLKLVTSVVPFFVICLAYAPGKNWANTYGAPPLQGSRWPVVISGIGGVIQMVILILLIAQGSLAVLGL